MLILATRNLDAYAYLAVALEAGAAGFLVKVEMPDTIAEGAQ